MQQLVGEYDVAIYYAPEDRQSDIGRASIVVHYDGDIVHLALKGVTGSTLVEVRNSRVDPMDYGQAAFTQVLGKIWVDQRDTPHERVDVTLSPNGSIYGYVGGRGEFFQFRNNIVHYGPTPPRHRLTQEGTWSSPQLALTCEQPSVTVEIRDDASVLLSGIANLDCEPGEVANGGSQAAPTGARSYCSKVLGSSSICHRRSAASVPSLMPTNQQQPSCWNVMAGSP